MTPHQAMQRIDELLSHVWMVRTFLKHSDEAEDEDIQDVYRTLYDVNMAVGEAWSNQDAEAYLKIVRKKLGKLRQASDTFSQVQPEVSGHMNFQMAARSLAAAVREVGDLLDRLSA